MRHRVRPPKRSGLPPQAAYLDVIALLAFGSAFMIPLVFLMKKRKPGQAGMAMH